MDPPLWGKLRKQKSETGKEYHPGEISKCMVYVLGEGIKRQSQVAITS
jgi:hypothetical protein